MRHLVRSLSHRSVAGVGISALLAALMLVLISAGTLWLNVRHLAEIRAEVARLSNVLNLIGDTLESVRAAETGQRGYLLTGHKRYLVTYEAGVPRVLANLQGLTDLVHDHEMRELVRDLRAVIFDKLAELGKTVTLAAEDREAALRIVRNDSGQQFMEQIETVVRALRARATLMLDQRWADEKASLETATLVAILTGGLALGCALLGAFLLVRLREQTGRQRAERTNAAKTEFLAAMSHEIRTPLNGVIGYADLLLEQPELGPTALQYGERIQSAGSALLTVVNDILDFSKVEAGEIALHPDAFPLAGLIDNTASIVRASAERKGVALAITVDPAAPAEFLGDQNRLRQVLLNLLNNAVKFTASGSVRLSVAAVAQASDEVRLRFAVQDTGIGIPAAKRHLLFERFSQVDGSIQREFGGTGLGLAISKRLVNLMRGEIGVESEEGRGSTFWFEVPLRVAQPTVLPQAHVLDRSERRSCRLLLVEDVPLNQELACAILRRGGHAVDVASSGSEAIQAVQATDYDLVLMDVQMPIMDGLTATRHIRALEHPNASVPIIALTANVLPQQVSEFRAAGMNDHVGKPFKQQPLFAAIERWARKPDSVPPPAPSNSTALDRATFAEVADSLGPDATRRLLAHLAEELEPFPVR
ncbi:ATP-binding protein [Methylobacterium sp. J-088]|uniref:ATP-binding protein n=1 Tax=Methylobacterium sp. J-088 TaxID=2836664 RepID=UPI0028C4ABA8|nr:ATP-binding protein [Methylobacterium sp. J-088]